MKRQRFCSAAAACIGAAVFLLLASCASNGTGTLGNGQIDIDLGDGKLFGSEKAYVAVKTAAEIAVLKDPTALFTIKDGLQGAKASLVDLEAKYPAAQATELAIEALLAECGVYCKTTAGRAYINPFILQVSDMADELAPGVMVSPREIIDALLSQIADVEQINAP